MIRILGPVRVDGPKGPIDTGGELPTATIALFASRPNTPISVDELEEFLWSDEPPRTAAAAIRNHCSTLRRIVAEATEDGDLDTDKRAGATFYTLRIGVGDLDALLFEDLVAHAEDMAFEGRLGQAASTFRSALDLWAGWPFDSVDRIQLAPTITRLSSLRLSAFEQLGELLVRLGRSYAAVALLEPLAPAHPDRETMAMVLMRALHDCGRAQDALSVAADTTRYLRNEQGLEPGAALRELERSILIREDVRPPQPMVGRSPLPPGAASRRGPFVGRRELLDDVESIVADHDDVCLIGIPGVGKTRLMAELAAGLDIDIDPIWLRAEADDPSAFSVFRHLVETLPLAVGRTVSVTDLLADIETLTSDAPSEIAVRRRVIEIVERIDGLLAGTDRRTVVLLDDAHEADSVSLQAIRYWLRQRIAPTSFVLAARDDGGPAWDDFLSGQTRLPTLHYRTLPNLSVRDIADWLRRSAMSLPLPPDVAAEAIHRQTGGTPFYAEAMIRELGRSDGAHAAELIRRIQSPMLPGGLDELLAVRLRRLGDERTRMLAAAAVVGRRFSSESVARIASASLPDIAWNLDERTADGVLSSRGLPAGDYEFDHDLIRAALVERLSGEEQRAVHLATLAELDESPTTLAVRAQHAAAAVPLVDPAEAVGLLRQAGDEAIRSASYLEAAALLELANGLVDQLPGDTVDAELDILISRAHAAQHVGARELVIDDFRRVIERAIDHDRPGAAARCALAAADFGEILDDTDPVRELLERALAVQPADSEDRADLAAELVIKRGIIDGATDELRKFHEHELGPEGSAGRQVGRLRSWLHLMAGSPGAADRLRQARELAAHARAVDGPGSRSWLDAKLFEISALLELGEVAEAQSAVTVYAAEAESSGRPGVIWLARVAECDLAQLAGDLDAADVLARSALRYGVEHAVPDAVISYGGHSLVTRLLTNQAGDTHGDLPVDYLDQRPLAVVAAAGVIFGAAGDVADARRATEFVTDRLADTPTSTLIPFTIMLACEAALSIGDPNLAARLFPLLEPYGGTMPRMALVGSTLGPADRQLGLLRCLQDDAPGAEPLLRTALGLTAKAGARAWQLATAIDLVELTADPGDAARLDEMHGNFGELPLPWLLGRAAAASERFGDGS